MKDVNVLVEELFSGYANNLITDRELGDMLDLVTNEYTVVVDNNEDDVDFFEVCQGSEISEFSYDLEASQYDYL
tara:strand:- start:410 stop:631 length:222 start_codon:yes stop_codon:yes gene_type:complete